MLLGRGCGAAVLMKHFGYRIWVPGAAFPALELSETLQGTAWQNESQHLKTFGERVIQVGHQLARESWRAHSPGAEVQGNSKDRRSRSHERTRKGDCFVDQRLIHFLSCPPSDPQPGHSRHGTSICFLLPLCPVASPTDALWLSLLMHAGRKGPRKG